MRKSFKSLFFVVLSIFFFFAGALFSQKISGAFSLPQDTRQSLSLFHNVLGLVQSDFVEKVPVSLLIEGALKGMLKSLDPYSQFLDKESFQDLEMETQGRFGGLGLEVSFRGGILHVISPMDESPADRAGIKPGDAIIKIDESATRDMSLSDAVHRMRGVPGSQVKLTLMREGEAKLIELTLKRDIVKIKSIREAKLLEGQVGYIRLSAFQDKSGEDFEKALEELKSKGMRGLILDVRNNSGGLLLAAVEVAERLIPKGQLIVYTQGRNAKKDIRFVSQSKKTFNPGSIAVLVNSGSASASEILAGALQDHGIATIVGSRSFGKGSIQSLFPLPDGTALRFTTSKYCTPLGRTIHEKGVEPEITVVSQDGSLEDAVLQKALEVVLKSREKNA